MADTGGTTYRCTTAQRGATSLEPTLSNLSMLIRLPDIKLFNDRTSGRHQIRPNPDHRSQIRPHQQKNERTFHIRLPGLPSPKFHRRDPRKISTIPGKSQQPHANNQRSITYRHSPHHQYNPCRGSSIGRACGSYQQQRDQPQGRGFEPHLRLFLYLSSFRAAVLLPFLSRVLFLFGRPGVWR